MDEKSFSWARLHSANTTNNDSIIHGFVMATLWGDCHVVEKKLHNLLFEIEQKLLGVCKPETL